MTPEDIKDITTEYLPLITEIGFRLISAVFILIAGWMIGNWFKKRIGNIKKIDTTITSFLGALAKYAVLAIAFITVLGQFGVQTASLLAVLGAAGLAIGLALQGTLSNVASGVMMLILRPFNVGDFIEARSISGTVKSLGLFATELATPDNVYVFAPNSQIWSSDIKNFSRNKQRRIDIVCGVSYSDNIDAAFKTFERVTKAEKRLIRTSGKEPLVMVTGLGDSSVDITARVWVNAADYWAVYWDMTKNIKQALDKDGISIPFPTRTIEYATPLETIELKPTKATKKKTA